MQYARLTARYMGSVHLFLAKMLLTTAIDHGDHPDVAVMQTTVKLPSVVQQKDSQASHAFGPKSLGMNVYQCC